MIKKCSQHCINEFTKLGYLNCELESIDSTKLKNDMNYTHILHLDKDKVFLNLELDCNEIIDSHEISISENVNDIKNTIINCCISNKLW